MKSRILHLLLSCAATGLVLGIAIIGTDVLAAEKTQPKAAAAGPAAKPAFNPNIGTSTGLPLPRFVALRADAVNLRVGPGDQYPILWVYHRVGLPVEVLREFDVWRLVIDSNGTKGWMHEATLMGGRHFVVTGQGAQTLFRQPASDARPRAQLMPGVVGTIERCGAGSPWCRVRVDHMAGWLQRSEFWGTLPGEKIPAK
ncbi:SH3 domain-containing protein [Acidisoma sp. C75]